MQKKTIATLVCCVMGMSALGLLVVIPSGLAVGNDWISETYNNDSIANAYDLDGKYNSSLSSDPDYFVWDYPDLNVSVDDANDYFNLTLPADYSGNIIVETESNLQFNLTIHDEAGNPIIYTDTWNTEVGGYQVQSPIVSVDTDFTINITWLGDGGATDKLYDLYIRLDHYPSEFDVEVEDAYAYSATGTIIQEDFGMEEIFRMFNVSAVLENDLIVDSTYGAELFRSVYTTWYNRTFLGAPWIQDNNFWNPGDPFAWYNACISTDYAGGQYLFIFPEDYSLDAINETIWVRHGLGGTDSSVLSVDTREITISTKDEYGLPQTWYLMWDNNNILVSWRIYNDTQDFQNLQRSNTHVCDCAQGAWSWGVSVGQKLEWEFKGMVWDYYAPSLHWSSIMQLQLEVKQIVSAEHKDIAYSGLYPELRCGLYSTIYTTALNRSGCEGVWSPFMSDSTLDRQYPFFAYNACDYGMWVHQLNVIPMGYHIPLLLPTPVDMLAFNESMNDIWSFGDNGCTMTVTGRNLVIVGYPGRYSEPTTMNYTYNSAGILTHFRWTNDTDGLYYDVKYDPCAGGSPTTTPPPGDFTLPEGVTPPAASAAVTIPAGEGQSFSVSDPGSGLSVSIEMNTTKPINMSFGLWASNPSSVAPSFAKVDGKDVGVFFAIEVNDTSAVKFPIKVTVKLPAELLTEATAEAIAKGLAIATLQDGKWVVNKTATITVDKTAGTATVTLWHLSVFALGQAPPKTGFDIPGLSPCLMVLSMLGVTMLLVRKRERHS